MTVRTDITIPAYSFAAGIAAGTILLGTSRIPASAYVTSALALAGALAIIARLMLGHGRKIGEIIILFVLTGLFCAAIDAIPHIRETSGRTGTAEAISQIIKGIRFNDNTTAPLVNALMTGDKSSLDRSVISAFRDSGASHILALSGLHLGLIYAVLLKITSILGNSPRARIIRSIFLVSASGYYTIATGMPPSLVRAFLFIALRETAKLLHRNASPGRIFCTALMIQLAMDPSVITSAGFQLSYLAMAGIFFIYPKMKAWYPDAGNRSRSMLMNRMDLPGRIWDISALTLSCQLMTGPLAWLRFGTFPMNFLLTNLLAMPVTSLLMTLAVPAVALSALGICPGLLISLIDYAASTLIFIMEVIAGM